MIPIQYIEPKLNLYFLQETGVGNARACFEWIGLFRVSLHAAYLGYSSHTMAKLCCAVCHSPLEHVQNAI